MHDTTRFTAHLESARRFLISVPWESKRTDVAAAAVTPIIDVSPIQQQQQQQQQQQRETASRTSNVLCQLLELRHLRGVLHAASAQQQQQQQQQQKKAREETYVARESTKRSGKNGGEVKAAREEEVLWCMLQRFLDVRAGCDRHVLSLCADSGITARRSVLRGSISGGVQDCAAADALAAALADADVIDVFLALLLCLSAALCWHHKQQQQQRHPVSTSLTPHGASARVGGVVSSSRDTSAHSQRGSAGSARHTTAPHASVYAAIREHYHLDNANSEGKAAGQLRMGLHDVLRRLLPLFEARLSIAELWREPSLLAALDVVARAAWTAQACVHAHSSGVDAAQTCELRCPMCYAAALDDDLAVEAFAQLQVYSQTYHGEEISENRKATNTEEAVVAVQARGWTAACRIALWNDCRAALRCLTTTTSAATRAPWVSCEAPTGSPTTIFTWTREPAAALGTLWQLWWAAEMPLSAGSTAIVLRRDASKRLRSLLLFLEVLDRAARVIAGAEETCQPQQRRALLRWLLSLPLPLHREERSSTGSTISTTANTTGTLLHWLCARGDGRLLLRLLLLQSGADDLLQLSAWAAAHEHHKLITDAAAGASNAQQHAEQPVRADRHDTPHVVHFTQRTDHSSGAASSPSTARARSAVHDTQLLPPLNLKPASSSAQLRHLLALCDSRGRSVLDAACSAGDHSVVRMLLEAGCSPNALHSATWKAKAAAALPLPLLRLLYDPSLLDGAYGTAGGEGSSSSRPGLAERLRSTRCPAAAARTLAQLSHRLWKEKTQHLSLPVTDENAVWAAAYAEVQAAQDRVLRPALAAMAYDAYEPLARLVVLAVLTRKLDDWLRTAPQRLRGSSDGDAASHWDLRLHHTTVLRLYTQLTCPLGRRVLDCGVAARCGLCRAVEAREASAVALLRTPAAADLVESGVTNESDKQQQGHQDEGMDVAPASSEGMTEALPPPPALLPPSVATTTREELQRLYAAVVADVQRVDALLMEEQQRLMAVEAASTAAAADAAADAGAYPCGDEAAAGAASVLRGRRRNEGEKGAADEPSYVLVVVPSALALQRARWGTSPSSTSRKTCTAPSHRMVEPTLWCASRSPWQVWVQLPSALHLDRLLRDSGGGAYGVVAHDVPPIAPVQRGDLVTFLHVKGAAGAPARFVVQSIFSERRTLPYLVLSTQNTTPSEYTCPPASLTLPFTALTAEPLSSCGAAVARRLRGASTVTVHACCLPTPYIDAGAGEDEGSSHSDAQHTPHPLDWLQARPATSTAGSTDVLSALRTEEALVARWSRMVWAGLQPCWLAAATATAADTVSPTSSHPLLTAMQLFTSSVGEEDETRCVLPEAPLMTLHLAPTRDQTSAEGGEKTPPMKWSSRADALCGTAEADVVVSVRV